jgi:hypothetical protein
MALAAYHLALGLPGLLFESRPLPLDPPEFADHRQPHGLIAHGQRRGHAHAAARGIDSQVQVFDGLSDHVHRKPANADLPPLNNHSDSSPAPKRLSPRPAISSVATVNALLTVGSSISARKGKAHGQKGTVRGYRLASQ